MNRASLLLLLNSALICPDLIGQHLWWNLDGQRDATCLYGEITVLATSPGTYYCGANRHPGERTALGQVLESLSYVAEP